MTGNRNRPSPFERKASRSMEQLLIDRNFEAARQEALRIRAERETRQAAWGGKLPGGTNRG